MIATHKTDSHAKPGRRPRAPPKEGATFDTELQRYVMPGERRAIMTKQRQEGVRHKGKLGSSGNDKPFVVSAFHIP